MKNPYSMILVKNSSNEFNFLNELKVFNQLLHEHRFLIFLKHPYISHDSKTAVIDSLLLTPFLTKIINFMLIHREYEQLVRLANDYEVQIGKKLGIISFVMTFANIEQAAMADDVLANIKRHDHLNNVVLKETKIDEQLISGFKLETYGQVYNYNIDFELQKRQQMKIRG